jgi:hypothetical protein
MRKFLNKCLLSGLIFMSSAAFAEDGMTVSGLLDSKVNLSAGAGDAEDFSYGIEEYANLRIQTKLRENAVFYGAFNITALAGSSAQAALALSQLGASAGLLATPFIGGENYAAAMELERLYFRVNSDYADIDVGLMRLGFGYGLVFGPSDFLNPRNPLFPDARPRGILGAAAAFYPGDTKVMPFTAAPKDPLNSNGEGFLFGLLGEHHWDMLSLQGVYSFETPKNMSAYGVHRAGLSIKVDWEIGIFADLLYAYNYEASTDIDGLAASAGLDYSFYDGKFYMLVEYLFSGTDSATSRQEIITGFTNRNYLYASIRYSFTDYTNAALACLAGFDDVSFAPIITVEHELFQGLTLSLSGRIPLDQDVFSGSGEHGEFGPVTTGSHAFFTVKARLRF